jgi:hypothetical protein
MKRPTRIVAPPRRSKKPSTVCSRSSVIFSRSPWRSSQPRPSRRPSVNDVRSPSTAHAHTIAISTNSEIWPWPATSPPTITAVSPGATNPTNAPVSRNASAPTSR